jgi:acetyl-CoA synthetase
VIGPIESFRNARDVLLRHRDDPDAARAAFRWPELDAFNWVDDWFDTYATGSTQPGLVVVRDAGPEVVTFGELADRSKRVARWLVDHGANRGDRVLVMLTNVAPLWETMLACIRLGLVVIPATAQLTPADLDDRLSRGDVRHVVTDGDGAAKLRDPSRVHIKLCTEPVADRRFAAFDDARSAPAEIARVPTRARDPLLLYFTSGTTAKPKLVLHTHASYPVGHLTTMYWIGIREGDVHQNISSPGWAKHAWSSLFAPWNAGATVLVHDQPRFSAARALAVLRDHGVHTLCAPPTVWRMLILESLGERPHALRELVSAGEPLNPEVIDAVQRAWSITVRDGYGQTETTAQVGNAPGLPVRPGSMGKPLPGYEIALVDSAGNVAREGELAIKLGDARPLALMDGYVDDPERMAAAMAGGFYRTGDEAMIDDDGYIHFVGRGDDVFKSSDYRISPFELESVLVEHDAVVEAAVVPSPDPLRLSVAKAFVTVKPGVALDEATAHSIFEHCRARLAPYNRVRRIEFMQSLPKTISGKIRRVELRALEQTPRPHFKDPRESKEK